jgi:hypothetical protein
VNLKRIYIDSVMKQYAEDFVRHNNIAMRGQFDGDKNKQYIGILGQVAFYNYLFKKFPKLETGFDNGIDLVYKNYSIDVKTMSRKGFMKESYVNNFVGLQKKYNVDILVFLNYNYEEQIIEICGWIWKRDLDSLANFYPKGSIRTRDDNKTITCQADLYEIPQSRLNEFRL